MTKSIFIYHPKSGDRVFAEHPGDHVAITTWENGCRHVDGDIVELIFEAASPGAHWREAAKRAAGEMLALIGEGIAWDDGGVIHIAVTVAHAERVLGVMTVLAKVVNPHHSPGNLERMFLAGCAEIRQDGAASAFRLSPIPASPAMAEAFGRAPIHPKLGSGSVKGGYTAEEAESEREAAFRNTTK
jgi:hypothetical protein